MELLAGAFTVLTGIIIYTIFIVATKLLERRHLREKASKLSGPPCLPLIGNAHLFIGNTEAIMNQFIHLRELYPSPCRLWIGHRLLILISTPEAIKEVCMSPEAIDKGIFYDFARPWLGTGLLTASAQAVLMAEQMERHLGGPEFEICNYGILYSLDSVCETSMGVSFGAQTNGSSDYGEAIETVLTGITIRVLSPWLHPDFIFYRTQLGRDQKKNIKFLHAFTDNVIQERKKELLKNKNLGPGSADNGNDECNPTNRRKAFLDHLIELSHENETLTDEAIREEVDTMTVAATDTTAFVTSFTMMMMATYPEVQEKVYQELCEIYGDDDNVEINVTLDDLTRMNYLERVIKETMRLFPSAPFFFRTLNDDLDIGDHTLPKNSILGLAVLHLHRNEKYWPDPLKFDPNRFLPEEVAKRHPYAYLPFSGGLRGCIGSKYAMISMKTLLSTILRKYVLKKDKIVPIKDIRLKIPALLRPVEPIMLRIERRTRNVVSI